MLTFFRTEYTSWLTSFMLTNPSTARRVVVAVGVLFVAIAIRHIFDNALPESVAYVTFFPAVLVAAVLVGSWPAIWVTLACTIYAWFVFLGAAPNPSQRLVASAFFVIASSAFILLVHALRAALLAARIAQQAASRLARTRDLLFHELQHRVSNNLQMIASTLSIQKRALADPAARACLDAAAARIHTVAKVQHFLGSPTELTVNVGEMLATALPGASDVSLGSSDGCVELSVHGDGPTLSRDRATLVALVSTELVSNAIEHGRTNGSGKATITVTSGKAGNSTGFVEVRDRGDGLPADFDLRKSASTGLQLAELFVCQLGGQLHFRTDGGTVARTEFSLVEDASGE
jgi:two-component system, sensor histidine kinase PdtaS